MSEREPKFRVGQVVATVGTDILKFVPLYWRVNKIGSDRKRVTYRIYENGPWIVEKHVRALTKRERGKP